MRSNGLIGVVKLVFSMKVRAPRVRLDRFWPLLGGLWRLFWSSVPRSTVFTVFGGGSWNIAFYDESFTFRVTNARIHAYLPCIVNVSRTCVFIVVSTRCKTIGFLRPSVALFLFFDRNNAFLRRFPHMRFYGVSCALLKPRKNGSFGRFLGLNR